MMLVMILYIVNNADSNTFADDDDEDVDDKSSSVSVYLFNYSIYSFTR